LRFDTRLIQWLGALGCAAVLSVVAGCGGGGGNSSASNNSGSGTVNAVPVSVDSGVAQFINIPTVSVTLCAPGSTTRCQTIDHVQVDTGSFGLRIIGAAASQVIGSLPVSTVGGNPLAECTHFADGYTWGSVRTADVKIAGETASSLPIQIIGDMPSSTVPATGCVSGRAENSAGDIGANGILGIGVAPHDCGSACEASAAVSNYYACPNGANCARTAVPLAQQVSNPVSSFATDNNGVILQMPAVSSSGQSSAAGMLVFGIGTRSNNTFGAAQTFTTNASGDIAGTFSGNAVTAFFDSGSNAYFFVTSAVPQCASGSNAPGFYCPSSTQTLTANVQGMNGTAATLSLSVANASTLFSNTGSFVFNNLAGSLGDAGSLDIGLPFFYGRSIYYGIDQRASGGNAPFVAF
jgi:hypothetical protein